MSTQLQKLWAEHAANESRQAAIIEQIRAAQGCDVNLADYVGLFDLPEHINSAEGYELVWSDSFGGVLDPTKWKTAYPWGPAETINNEQGYFVNHFGVGNDAYPAVAYPYNHDEAGRLAIRAQQWHGVPGTKMRHPDTGEFVDHQPTHTTGLITTEKSFRFTYGYVDARVKLPKSCGSWPAIWLLHRDYPNTAEIDILEAPIKCGGHPAINPRCVQKAYHYTDAQGTEWSMDSFGVRKNGAQDMRRFGQGDIHLDAATRVGLTTSSTGGGSLGTVCRADAQSWGDDFHTFGVEWKPTELRWYIDGAPVASIREGDAGATIYDQEMYLIINLAIGGWYPGPAARDYRDELVVERVRIYQR